VRPLDRRLLRHARAVRTALLGAVAVAVAGTGLAIAQAWLLAGVVAGALAGWEAATLRGPLVALLGVALLRGLVVWGGEVLAQGGAAATTAQLRRRFLAAALAWGPVRLGAERGGELAVTATSGVGALDTYVGRFLPQLAGAALVPVVALAWVWPRDRLSAAILVVTLPLLGVFLALIGSTARQEAARQWGALTRLGGHFLDVVAGLSTLELLGRARAQVDTLRTATDAFRAATLRTLRVAFLSALTLELVAAIGTAMLAVGVGLRLVNGTLDLRTGLAILILAPEVYLPLRAVGQQFHASTAGLAAAERLLEVIEAPAGGAAAGAAPPPDPRRSGIALQGVTYRYPDRSLPALREVSLRIDPGERVAITGPSGAGKSTLLALLLGFATPDEGGSRSAASISAPSTSPPGAGTSHGCRSGRTCSTARSRTTCASAPRRPTTPPCGAPPRSPASTASSSRSGSATPPRWGSGASGSRGDSDGASPSRARSCATPPCCCSTSRASTSTPTPSSSSSMPCAGCRGTGR
jgi:ATP-binding cassette, subfamily C, bacterial CydCD